MKKIKRTFEFKTFEAIGSGPADYGKGVVRIRHENPQGKSKAAIPRNSMVKVQSKNGQVYAIVRYSNDLEDNQIAMEYDMFRELGASETKSRSAELTITKVPIWAYSNFFNKHPDPVIRYAERLNRFRAFVAFAVGVFAAVAFDLVADKVIAVL
ncbi:MAG: hypothetical protein RLO80_08480 [Hyphomonas sp.]